MLCLVQVLLCPQIYLSLCFWGVGDAPPTSIFIVLPILHERPPLPINSFVLLRSETDLWHTVLPSLSDSTSAQITRAGHLWQTYSHPCPLSHLGTISVLSQPPDLLCQGYFHAQGNRASKCWKGAKASLGEVINHTARGMRV